MRLLRLSTLLILVGFAQYGSLSRAKSEQRGSYKSVNVLIRQPNDQALRVWGLSLDEIGDAARSSVQREGWEIEKTAAFTIIVIVTPYAQRLENTLGLSIEVNGGPTEIESPDWRQPRLVARRIVDVHWDDHEAFLSVVDEMVQDIAFKLRARIPR